MLEERNKQYYEREQKEDFVPQDSLELISQFLLEPSLERYSEDYVDLDFINKNIVLSNIPREEKQSVINKCESLAIISKYKEVITDFIPSGEYREITRFNQETGEEVIVRMPLFVQRKRIINRFKNTNIFLSSGLFSLCASSAGSNLGLLKQMNTKINQKEETIEDKTATKSSWFGNRPR